jgi:hypothetical protein
MLRKLCCAFLFVFFQGAAAGTAFAENACPAFEGMWQPLYHETYDAFPSMREYMDGPNPAEDSFIKGLVEARRIVIDCKAKSIQSIQGLEAGQPRPFNIDSVNEQTLTINFIAERFNNPSSILERELAKKLHQQAPRVVFTINNDLLKMASEHESFVMRRAAPFQMK